MSPEQATGQIELTNAASDADSLGATLFSLLTNAVPISIPVTWLPTELRSLPPHRQQSHFTSSVQTMRP